MKRSATRSAIRIPIHTQRLVELDNPWLNRCRHLGYVVLMGSLMLLLLSPSDLAEYATKLSGSFTHSRREDSVMPLLLPPPGNPLPMTMSVLDSPAGSPWLSGITGHNYNTGSSDDGDYDKGRPPQQRNNSQWQGNDNNDDHNNIKTTMTARQDDGSRQQQQQDDFHSDDSDNANATCLFKQLGRPDQSGSGPVSVFFQS
ncbi:hypothetical protein EDB89DRAFT_1909480 [Lactarius sanguifluus]|nr:hypothetical protein EDB89DRAFT_1909480 [Lactarius sanguifluus]